MCKIFLLLLTSMLILSGCQVVSIKRQAINVTIANERDSILTRNKLSEASLNLLSMTGREAKMCSSNPEQCVTDLQAIPQIQDEQLLSTASEIYLAKAIELDQSAACKTALIAGIQSQQKQQQRQMAQQDCLDQQLHMLDKSIRYSYAYMFQSKRAPQDRLFDNRQVQIRDFYNQSLAKMVSVYTMRHQHTHMPQTIQVGESRYHLNFDAYPALKNRPIEQLISTYNLNFSGLRSINRRDGFGAEFALVLPEIPRATKTSYIVNPLNYAYKNGHNPNLHAPRYLAATITAQPKGAQSIERILHHGDFELSTYDPYQYENVKVAQKTYPLAANFSAPYGLWLAQNNLGKAAYLSLIDRDDRLTMPHLYMLEPYNPNKKVIILVHGLASSPEAWVRLTNDIMGDPVLREHYQVWQVFYSTNMPILESRFQIYALLTQAFEKVAPSAAAKNDAVLVGHSMGGIISRLLVSNADITQATLALMNNRQLNRYRNLPIVRQRMVMQQIPNINRAIFLATPHRGTDFADRWFTKAARKIIKLPVAFLTAVGDALVDEDPSLKEIWQQIDRSLIQNGPSDLSHQSKFMQLTQDIMPRQNVAFHSIIGNNTGLDDPLKINDDIVPYQSAHLKAAQSEKIIRGSHSIQETPEAVLELRRILRLHLTQLGVYKP